MTDVAQATASAAVTANQVDELAMLSAVTGGAVVVLGWAGDVLSCRLRRDPPQQPLSIPPIDGRALLPGTEAVLHVLLAWSDPDEIDRRIRSLDRVPFPVQNRALLALRLARVRTTGHDVFAGGIRGEVTSVAAPVRDASGAVPAALAVVAPSIYLEDLDMGALSLDVVRLASQLQDRTDLDACQ